MMPLFSNPIITMTQFVLLILFVFFILFLLFHLNEPKKNIVTQLHDSPNESCSCEGFAETDLAKFNELNEAIGNLEAIVDDISQNRLPIQFKVGYVLQQNTPIPTMIKSDVTPSSMTCSYTESIFGEWKTKNTFDSALSNLNQTPKVEIDGSFPGNVLLNFIFPYPRRGKEGPPGPMGSHGPMGSQGSTGEKGPTGYW